MREFTVKLTNFEGMNKLFKSQITKYNDLYLIPPVLASSRLAHSAIHISFHASGASHLRFNAPVACLHLGPNIKLPFNRAELLEDIATKKKSLITRIDLSNNTEAGSIAVMKTRLMLKDFFESEYLERKFEDRKYIDYYNLILTNPYRQPYDFKEYFPYKDIQIDAKIIKDSIKVYDGKNLYQLFIELKNNNIITEQDLVVLGSSDESFVVIMSGSCIGLRIDLNDIEGTIKKLPGAKTFYPLVKKAASFF